MAASGGDHGFIRAMLHTLDEQQQAQLDVARLLPALRTLVEEHSTKQQRGIAKDGIRNWLRQYTSFQEPSSAVPDKAGFLRKITQSGIVATVRWVVLDGSSLSYFSDRAETDLRGVLRLTGVRCTRLRSVAARRFSFRITAPVVEPETARPPPGMTRTKSGPSTITTSSAAGTPATGPDSSTSEIASIPLQALNPLNTGKTAYIFAANSDAEADAWVSAICAAAGTSGLSGGNELSDSHDSAASETDATRAESLRWSDSLSRQVTISAYRKMLRQLCRQAGQTRSAGGGRAVSRLSNTIEAWDLPLRPALQLDAEWTRVQLRAVWEREAAERNTDKSSSLSTTATAAAAGAPGGERHHLLPLQLGAGGSSTAGKSTVTSPILHTHRPAPLGSAAYQERVTASAAASGASSAYLEAAATAVASRPGGLARSNSDRSARPPAVVGSVADGTSYRQRIEPSVSALMPVPPRLRVPPGEDEDVASAIATAERAVAEAAASTAKRLWGFAPGDRVTLHQLDTDLRRDMTVIGGAELRGCGVETTVKALCDAVRRVSVSQAVASRSDCVAADSPDSHTVAGSVVPGQLMEAAASDAALSRFAFDVLRRCSRTTAGGDAYEALELALRCPNASLLVPESGMATPISLSVCSSTRPYAAPPIRLIHRRSDTDRASNWASDMCLPTLPLSTQELHVINTAMAPKRYRLLSEASEDERPTDDDHGSEALTSVPVWVVADTCMVYRIKSLDMMGDMEVDVDGDAEPAGPVETGHTASVGVIASSSKTPLSKMPASTTAISEAFSDSGSDSESDGEGMHAAVGAASISWQRGDIGFVAAHFRRVFPYAREPGGGVVRVYVTVRPGGGALEP